MPRARLSRACLAFLFATVTVAGSARAQTAASPGRVHEIALPGGLPHLLAVTGDSVTPDRSQFLVEFIRRTYNRPPARANLDREAALQSLLAGIDGSNGSAPDDETLPLPLPPAVWIDAVFGGRETPQTLLGALLQSRGAALLYYGLLSLDDDTRAWLAAQPRLVAELAGPRAAAFVVAAPGLRIRDTTVHVPGGEAAAPVWESLVGERVRDPAGFTRALLGRDEGRLAFFFGAMAGLTPGQLRVALRLDAPDAATRIDAARRLRAVFDRLTPGWRVDDSVFWRPAIDPALLAASLRHGNDGLPRVPGTRQFWSAVFAAPGRTVTMADADVGLTALAKGAPGDFTWLCEQVFTGNREEDRRRYNLVLFVSRLEARSAQWLAPEAVAAVRAAHTHPALVFSLERAQLVDVAAYAAAVRRAETLSAIRDGERAARAMAQYQGALALVTRAASRGGIRPQALAATISSLSAVEISERGDYEGRLVRWLTAWLPAHLRTASAPDLDVPGAGPLELDALAALAGPPARDQRFVDWEGTRYRLDFAGAEGLRLARLLGDQARPFLSSARALVAMADGIGREALTAEGLREHASDFEDIARAVRWDPGAGWEGTAVPRRYRDANAAVQRAARSADAPGARRIAPALLALADDLLARGLMELAYAVALGQPDRLVISADDAARRHEFASQAAGRGSGAWQFPSSGTTPQAGWRVAGSLLGLDIRLAEFALVRLSSKPPPRRPTLVDDNRRGLVEVVALMDAASLTDEDRATIVSAMRHGRARLGAARTPEDAVALADEIRLSPARRTLLSWAITSDPERVPTFLSPGELFWLGLERAPVAAGLHAWGASAGPRTGCLCLEVLDRQPLDTLAGRWNSGALSSGFPDLNLRLTELLEELGMPAQLLAPVLAAATLDLVESAATRDPDDRRALLDAVQALRRERVEQYLALLTVDGPLVPVDEGGDR